MYTVYSIALSYKMTIYKIWQLLIDTTLLNDPPFKYTSAVLLPSLQNPTSQERHHSHVAAAGPKAVSPNDLSFSPPQTDDFFLGHQLSKLLKSIFLHLGQSSRGKTVWKFVLRSGVSNDHQATWRPSFAAIWAFRKAHIARSNVPRCGPKLQNSISMGWIEVGPRNATLCDGPPCRPQGNEWVRRWDG